MTSRLNLIVLRSLEPKRTVGFYESLGIDFQSEQHGSGPVHWAANLDGLVLEVYPAKATDDVGGPTRIGFDIEDAANVLAALKSSGFEIVSDLSESQ